MAKKRTSNNSSSNSIKKKQCSNNSERIKREKHCESERKGREKRRYLMDQLADIVGLNDKNKEMKATNVNVLSSAIEMISKYKEMFDDRKSRYMEKEEDEAAPTATLSKSDDYYYARMSDGKESEDNVDSDCLSCLSLNSSSSSSSSCSYSSLSSLSSSSSSIFSDNENNNDNDTNNINIDSNNYNNNSIGCFNSCCSNNITSPTTPTTCTNALTLPSLLCLLAELRYRTDYPSQPIDTQVAPITTPSSSPSISTPSSQFSPSNSYDEYFHTYENITNDHDFYH